MQRTAALAPELAQFSGLPVITWDQPEASQQSLYRIAREITNDRPDLGLAFSLQPNIFGFSIDLIKAGSYLRGLLQDRRRHVGREFSTPSD
jgi:hypothetical protein